MGRQAALPISIAIHSSMPQRPKGVNEEPLRWKIGPFARAFPPGAPLRRGGVVAQAAGPRGAAQARRGAPVVRFAALALSTPHIAAAPLN